MHHLPLSPTARAEDRRIRGGEGGKSRVTMEHVLGALDVVHLLRAVVLALPNARSSKTGIMARPDGVGGRFLSRESSVSDAACLRVSIATATTCCFTLLHDL